MKRKFALALIIGFMAIQNSMAADDFELGKSAFQMKDYKTANKHFVQFLIKNPNDAIGRYYYAQTLTYLNNYEQARKEYGYVIQLAPSSKAAEYAQQAIVYLDEKIEEKQIDTRANDLPKPQGSISTDTYIQKALTSNGELVTWDLSRMPLKVYVDNSYGAKQIYLDATKSALQQWQSASNGLVSFAYTSEASTADIKIIFKGMATKSDNQALGYTQHSSSNGFIDTVSVVLYTSGPNYQILSADDVYNVALHEFGHMLGIWGHSDEKSDIMYALYDVNSKKNKMALSARDKNTVAALYSIDKNPYSNKTNSINKILGSKDQRVDTKIQQGLDYIKEVPGNPTGYVNLGNTYFADGQEYEAISYYKKALKIDNNCEEAHLNLARIYYNRNDLRNAEIHFKSLFKISPKNSANYCNLINLYIRNNKISNANSTLSTLLYRNNNAKNDECVVNIMKRLNRK